MHGGGGGWGHGGGRHGMDHDEALGAAYHHRVVSRLAAYTTPYRRPLLLALVCTLVYSASHAAGPRIIGLAIDGFIATGDVAGLSAVTAVFLGNGAIILASQAGQSLALAWVGQRVLHHLRTDLFNHLQKLSPSFFDTNSVGRLMSRAQNDVLSLQELLTGGFFNVLQDVITLGIVVTFLVTMNLKLALVTLMVVPALIVIMLVWQRLARAAFMEVRQAIAVVNAGLQENISGVRVIQSLTREDRNSREFDRVNAAHFTANLQAGRLSAVVQPLVEVLVAVATALVVVFGGHLVLGGELAIGELVAFALYVQRFFDPIRELTMQYTQFQRAMVGGDRIFEVLDTQPQVRDTPGAIDLPPVRGAVRFEQLSFEYIPGIPVLRSVDLDVQPGETIALVGATGAGKSSMLSLLARFYDATGGRITIDGHDVRAVTQNSLRRQIGMVLQDPFLFTGTVRENLRYGRLAATDATVEAAARLVGAHDFIARLERGYDTVLHERGGNLSVGQRQLLSIARAALAEPGILLLDEATANVDTQTELVIQGALRELLRGRTSFVIAHRLSTIRDADRIVVMEQGRIIEAGTHDALLARGGAYASLYTMSFAAVAGNGGGHHRNGASEAAPRGPGELQLRGGAA